jgi:hyperosmotically inducible periplasmic protein
MKRKLIPALVLLTIVYGEVQADDTVSAYSAPVETHAPKAASGPAQSKQVRKAAKIADRKLEKSVRKALMQAKDVEIADVVVFAKTGVVTLTGTVPDTNQIDTAARHAQDVEGVQRVVNRLTLPEQAN